MSDTTRFIEALRVWSGAAALVRGAEVLARGALFDTRRVGPSLRARCHGQESGLYHPTLTLSDDDGAIASGHCTCPAGADGRCKHTAALGLRFAAEPEAFVRLAPLAEALRGRTRAELVLLIEQMVQRHPELDALVTLPMPGGRSRGAPEAADFGRQADGIFDAAGSAWGAEVAILDALSPLAALARRFADAHDLPGCLAVSQGLTDSVYRHLPAFLGHHHADDLREVVRGCVEAVGSCLARHEDPAAPREAALTWLLETRAADLELGDVGPAEVIEALLPSATTPAERAALAARLGARDAPHTPGTPTAWETLPDGALRFELVRDTLSDPEFLAGCEALGRAAEQVERLLALGRWQEALDVARRAPLRAMQPIAEHLVAYGAPEVAEALVLARAEQSRDPSLLMWLLGRARQRGDGAAVRSLAETLVEVRPDVQAFGWLREATAPADWEPARERALGLMLGHGRVRDYLEALLSEGLVARAAAHVRSVRPSGDLALRVAEAAAGPCPDDALAIWEAEIEALVGRRTRGAYAEAATLAGRAVETLRRLGRHAEADGYGASLRRRHGRMRALHEALDAAGV